MSELESFFEDFLAKYPRVQNFKWLDLKEVIHSEELNHWLESNYFGQMEFMANTQSLRVNPQEWFAEARSVLVWLWDYPSELKAAKNQSNEAFQKPLISSYASGLDYHLELGQLSRELAKQLKEKFQIESRAFADAQPVFERDWGLLAGLGWLGKNTFLINQKVGTSFFISGLFLSEAADKKALGPAQDFCGQCTRCLDACPTDAFVEPYVLDAQKCLSYLTIEHKGSTPKEFWGKNEGWIFGCDVCQQVCPWNHKEIVGAARLGAEKSADQSAGKIFKTFENESKLPAGIAAPMTELSLIEWLKLCRKGGGFQSRFKGTPLLRAGRQKMLRNVALESFRQKDLEAKDLLIEIAAEEDGWVKEILVEILTEWEIS